MATKCSETYFVSSTTSTSGCCCACTGLPALLSRRFSSVGRRSPFVELTTWTEPPNLSAVGGASPAVLWACELSAQAPFLSWAD